MKMSDQLDKWMGEFGDSYTDRNMSDDINIQNRMIHWSNIYSTMMLQGAPEKIFEVGANIGSNLLAHKKLSDLTNSEVKMAFNEPNEKARNILKQNIPIAEEVEGDICNLKCDNGFADIVFTCGVLIHIHPDDLLQAMKEVYRVSSKYIICSEYFSPTPREVKYRNMDNMLWARDYGSEWLDNFKGLYCMAYSFSWKRMSGMDNITTWIFQKVN